MQAIIDVVPSDVKCVSLGHGMPVNNVSPLALYRQEGEI